jgi:transcriptional regulator with XRE-family HTH domain
VPPKISPAHVAFGRAIQALRTERGLTQEELGYRAGLDRSYMGDVERGERNVSLTNILKIARALDVDTTDLFASFEALRR